VLLTGFPAGPFGTNCFIIAPGAGSECIVVDPGMGALEPARDTIREHNLRPVAVLLTHGHLDHTWSVVPVAKGYGIAAYIHSDDDHMLTDPLTALGPDMRHMVSQLTRGEPLDLEPEDLRHLRDGEILDLAGITLRTTHAPGHTPGSVVFIRDGDAELPPIMFSGDVLFAGSIGRTDLPGGDHAAMLRSLRDVILPQPDDMVVLPGHGAQTSIGAERGGNPFLAEVIGRSGHTDGPRPQRRGM
jgi:glyoxylase-like metal-dependent hydrolase (beta-lactamase superfamily II)